MPLPRQDSSLVSDFNDVELACPNLYRPVHVGLTGYRLAFAGAQSPVAISRQSGSHLLTSSTLRFWARPSSVELSPMGTVWPRPTAVSLEPAIP